MSVEKTFEFVLNGQTYQTVKMNPKLRGRISRVLGYVRKETAGHTDAEIETQEWLQVVTAGVLFEHLPDILWDFLAPQDKQKIGTKENLEDALIVDHLPLVQFWHWAMSFLNETHNFLSKTPEAEAANQSDSKNSILPSAGDSDGLSTIANPSVS